MTQWADLAVVCQWQTLHLDIKDITWQKKMK
jgi:hypothetical protein